MPKDNQTWAYIIVNTRADCTKANFDSATTTNDGNHFRLYLPDSRPYKTKYICFKLTTSGGQTVYKAAPINGTPTSSTTYRNIDPDYRYTIGYGSFFRKRLAVEFEYNRGEHLSRHGFYDVKFRHYNVHSYNYDNDPSGTGGFTFTKSGNCRDRGGVSPSNPTYRYNPHVIIFDNGRPLQHREYGTCVVTASHSFHSLKLKFYMKWDIVNHRVTF